MKVSETKCESYVNRLKKSAQIQLQKKRTQNAIIRRPIKMNQSQAALKRQFLLYRNTVNVF